MRSGTFIAILLTLHLFEISADNWNMVCYDCSNNPGNESFTQLLGESFRKNGCCYNSDGKQGYSCPCSNSSLEQGYGFKLTDPSDPNSDFVPNKSYEACQTKCWTQAMSCFLGYTPDNMSSSYSNCVLCKDPQNYQYDFEVCSNSCFNYNFPPYQKSQNPKDWQDLPDYQTLFEYCNVDVEIPCTSLNSTYSCALLPGGNFSEEPCESGGGTCISGGCPTGSGPKGC